MLALLCCSCWECIFMRLFLNNSEPHNPYCFPSHPSSSSFEGEQITRSNTMKHNFKIMIQKQNNKEIE